MSNTHSTDSWFNSNNNHIIGKAILDSKNELVQVSVDDFYIEYSGNFITPYYKKNTYNPPKYIPRNKHSN